MNPMNPSAPWIKTGYQSCIVLCCLVRVVSWNDLALQGGFIGVKFHPSETHVFTAMETGVFFTPFIEVKYHQANPFFLGHL